MAIEYSQHGPIRFDFPRWSAPMNSIRIAPLAHREPGVSESIHAVQLLAYRQEAALLQVTSFAPLQAGSADIRASQERFLGAFAGPELVGAVGIGTDTVPGRKTIASLVVAPRHQRRGIGRLLMAAALRECEGSVVSVSTGARNIPALALYEDLGFIEYERRTVGPEGIEIVMLRRPVSVQTQRRTCA